MENVKKGTVCWLKSTDPTAPAFSCKVRVSKIDPKDDRRVYIKFLEARWTSKGIMTNRVGTSQWVSVNDLQNHE